MADEFIFYCFINRLINSSKSAESLFMGIANQPHPEIYTTKNEKS
jgi:hypothetical protein